MQIRVDLGGALLPWRFRDTGAFERWLQERPWGEQGGVLLVRTSGPTHAATMAKQLDWEHGRADVHVTLAIVNEGDREGFPIVSSVHELSKTMTRREALLRCADELVRRPTLIVSDVSGVPETEARRLVDELEQVREDVNKVKSAAALCVVLLGGPAAATSRVVDLTQGAPVLDIGWASGEREDEVWARYAHARVAWEAGGDIDRAFLVCQYVQSGPAFDEGALEHALNDGAAVIRRALSPDDDAAIANTLRDGDWEPLVERRLAWRPLGLAHARPVPWLARSILREDPGAAGIPVLCSSLVCMPVAQAVMTRCLDAEALVRSRFAARTDAAPEKAVASFRAFRAGTHSDTRFYPPDSPVLAHVSPWTFANLGDFTWGLGLRDKARRALERLRELRNSVMHGHYVCYRTLSELRTIEQSVVSDLHGRSEPEIYRMIRS